MQTLENICDVLNLPNAEVNIAEDYFPLGVSKLTQLVKLREIISLERPCFGLRGAFAAQFHAAQSIVLFWWRQRLNE